ncbi:SH3 domain-containing protein [Leptolyngbya sp. CCY15150]|uniref:SH3 domain-containing protein n=1 Tax=Leptolyngbya sp. CCY15150 TaxID=2767772 RepID=UPI00195245B7|nr:SH3 domain-containing protein [Leptolyngbya sp. CCY15150]
MRLLGLIKFLLGFFLAIALLFVAGVGATRYLITKLTAVPERPVFANDGEASDPAPEAEAPPEVFADVPEEPDPSAVEEDEPDELDEEGYTAIVTQPIGLILREDPDQESRRITGLAYNTEVEILGESDTQEWLRVRLPGSGIEGWVRAGNTTPAN